MTKEHIIIGGGVSGLTRAYKLCAQGNKVRLFEPGALGGVIRTRHEKGFIIEQGPAVLVLKPRIEELLRTLELESQIVYPAIERFRQYVWYENAPRAVSRSPLGLFLSPLFRKADSLSLVLGVLSRGRFAPRADDESVEQFFSRILGRHAVKALLEPALQGIFGGDISKLSARSLFPLLWEHLRSDGTLLGYRKSKGARKIFVLRGGMSSLIERLRERCGENLTVRPQSVRGVSFENDGTFQVVDSSGETFKAEKLSVCTSGTSSASYLPEQCAGLKAELEKMRSAPLMMLHVRVAHTTKLPERGFGVLFPPGRPSALLGVMFNSQLFPHLAPEGSHLLTACIGGINREDVLALSDQQIVSSLKAELKSTLQIVIEDQGVLALQRWPRAIPQYEIGHHRIEEGMQQLEARLPGLSFCGADRGGVGVPDRIHTAW